MTQSHFHASASLPANCGVRISRSLALLALSVGAIGTSQEVADVPRLAIPVDGDAFPARVRAIDQDWKITFQAGGRQRVFAAQDLVGWGDYQDTCTRSQIVLAEGGLLVADVLQLSGESLVANGDLCGQVTWPLSAVRGVLVDPPWEPLRRDRLLDTIRSAQGAEDQLRLDNEDLIAGTLKSWREAPDAAADRPATITLATKGRDLQVSADTVVALILNPALVRLSKPREGVVDMGFRDGSLLRVTKVATAGATTRLTLPGALELELATDVLCRELTLLRPSGNRVVYLSDLPPIGYKHIPLLESPWPLQPDRSTAGGRLRHGGHVFSKGLGMHSTSRVAYDLDGQYRRFQAEVAVDDDAGLRGAVTVRVLFEDVQGQWQRAFESAVVRGGAPPLPIAVDVTGVKRMALIVDFAERGDLLDHADWLNARLIK